MKYQINKKTLVSRRTCVIAATGHLTEGHILQIIHGTRLLECAQTRAVRHFNYGRRYYYNT